MNTTSTATASPKVMEPDWNDLAVILAVCRSGSLSGAARMLGYNHSTVFRKINAIEKKTGVRFFERLPQGYVMTEAGQTAMRYAERIETEVHALGREVLGQDLQLRGNVRVTSPEGIATDIAPPILAEFCRRNPEVSVDLLASNAALDLSRREAEVALRATPKPPDSSLGRKICDFRFALYAAPEYLDRNPDVPLQEHDWCLLQGIVQWLVPLIWKNKSLGESRTVFTAGATRSILNAASAGLGITALPCYVGDGDERLVRVSPPLERLNMELWILTHPDLRHTVRVRALMEFLYDAFRRERDLFEGNRPQEGARILYKPPA